MGRARICRENQDMSQIPLNGRTELLLLPAAQVISVREFAASRLENALLRAPDLRRLGKELGLPRPHSASFGWQVRSLVERDEPCIVKGHRIWLEDLACQIAYERRPHYGVLLWLLCNTRNNGWAGGEDRAAMADEIDAAIEPRDRAAWAAVTRFLRSGKNDIVLSGPGLLDWRLAWGAGTWHPLSRAEAGRPAGDAGYQWSQLDGDARWEVTVTAVKSKPEFRWHPGRYRFSGVSLAELARGN